MISDLHIHSNLSDGELAPAETLARAAAQGVEQVSITDHDNLHAYDQLSPAAIPAGLRVVTGIELDAHLVHLTLGIRKIEILGYAFDPASPGLRGLVDDILTQRRLRGRALMNHLNERFNAKIWPEDLLRENATVLTPRVLAPYVRKGLFPTIKEARAAAAGVPGLPRVRKITAETAIALIHEAGGKAVLAHPARTDLHTLEEASLALNALRDAGLDGFEARYGYERDGRKHNKFEPEALVALWPDALLTGGSDAHVADYIGKFTCPLPPMPAFTPNSTA